MSTQQQAQFSPAQVLDAAQRAEVEGRLDLAHQFYTHLAEHFSGTAEGNAAQGALLRLGTPRVEAPPVNGFSLSNPFSTVPEGPISYPASAPARYPDPPPATPAPIHVDLPPPANGYRIGRLLGRAVAWLGGLTVLFGAALIPLSILGPKALTALPGLGLLLAAGPRAGFEIAATGVVLVILGQLARALFDQANATRDLAAITRAEAEGRHPPIEPEPVRRRRKRQ